jgi:hypothetical protein
MQCQNTHFNKIPNKLCVQVLYSIEMGWQLEKWFENRKKDDLWKPTVWYSRTLLCIRYMFKRLCMVKPTSALAVQHPYILLFPEQQSCCEWSCDGSVFVFIQDLPPPPTVNQSCQCWAIRSPLHCYNIWEAHSNAVQSTIWPLRAFGGSTIVSSAIRSLRSHYQTNLMSALDLQHLQWYGLCRT